MKKIKFRWLANGRFNYREVKVPGNADQLMYVDKNGIEVYEDDIDFDEEMNPHAVNRCRGTCAEGNIDISLLEFEFHRSKGKKNYNYKEHEPLDLTQGVEE